MWGDTATDAKGQLTAFKRGFIRMLSVCRFGIKGRGRYNDNAVIILPQAVGWYLSCRTPMRHPVHAGNAICHSLCFLDAASACGMTITKRLDCD
jgi:hypothetical protein